MDNLKSLYIITWPWYFYIYIKIKFYILSSVYSLPKWTGCCDMSLGVSISFCTKHPNQNPSIEQAIISWSSTVSSYTLFLYQVHTNIMTDTKYWLPTLWSHSDALCIIDDTQGVINDELWHTVHHCASFI